MAPGAISALAGARPRSRPTDARSFKSLVLPNLALTASLITLFYCLFLFEGYQKLFRDSDSGWHIRSGETILGTGALPRADPYSFTRGGEPWFAWEWGSDLLMGAAHRMAGLSGVAMLYGTAIALGVWLWFQLHWRVGGNFLLACALAAPMLSTANLHWLARPHVFSWIFLLWAVVAANGPAPHDRFRVRHALAIGAVSAVWANMHASFFLAPVIAAIYAAGHGLRPFIWNIDRGAEFRKARWFACAGVVALLASLANPYGWRLHEHVFRYLADSDLLARIGEFQSFNFHVEGAFQILLALGVAAVGAVLSLGQGNLGHFLLAAAVIGAALRSARGLPLVALLLLPLANGAITAALANSSHLRPPLRRAIDSFLDYSARLRQIDARCKGLIWAPVLAVTFFALLRAPAIAAGTGFPADQFPVAAAARVEQLPEAARVFAPDKFGGYLIYRFNGKRKVFFDGRSDLYGGEFLKVYGRMTQVRPGWRAQWDAFHFTHALLPNDYSLIPALEQSGWERVYRDDVATLLAGRQNSPGE